MQWMHGYPYYLLMGGAFGLYVSLRAYPFRNTPGRRYVWLLMLCSSAAVFATVCELMTDSFAGKLWWRNLQQLPFFLSGLFFYAFARDYVGRSPDRMRRQLFRLFIPMALYVLLIYTDPFHHLMRSSVGLETVMGLSSITVQPTLLNMAFIVYSQLLCLYAVFCLLICLPNTPKHYYTQHLLLLGGGLLPVVALLVLPILNIPVLGYTSLSFLPAGVIMYLALFRNRAASIWPIAKDKVFEHMKDGVILVDRHDVIADLNRPAGEMLALMSGERPAAWIGRPIRSYFHPHPDLQMAYRAKKEHYIEIDFAEEDDLCYGVSFIPVGAKDAQPAGMLLILYDHSDKKRYERELIYQATKDDLTGVFNRREFLRRVNLLLETGESVVSLLLFDLDDFKLINDTHGHRAGDQALSDFAGHLQQFFSGKGIAARIGGEEFAVCLSGYRDYEALEEAEKFRVAAASRAVLLPAATISVTVSIGIAHGEQPGSTFEELYQQADAALYHSKETGKNKTTVANGPSAGS
ncbi:histidine kinase N-terminal 7TM domain-containing diguanylate cyclase [Paenibacillus sp. y28]|uniref:histidine kinase N-terminal 7TM domain-containing diguanylate cyclase n=1 Tax=Paenibacillus sp. y28 TaxID=3129110 RepID=UPI003018CBFC